MTRLFPADRSPLCKQFLAAAIDFGREKRAFRLADLPVKRRRRDTALQQLPDASEKLAVAKRLADKVVPLGVVGDRVLSAGNEEAFQHRIAEPRIPCQFEAGQPVRQPEIGLPVGRISCA